GKSGSLPGWQLCRGISGSFRVEWVAGFVWNQWQPWSGIRMAVRFKPLLLILKTRNKSHSSTPFLLCSKNITNRKWHGPARVVANNGNRASTEFPVLACR
ncbi:hypothetical protein, partial [Marinobacter sp. ST-43]|uniref:hypothetical protein n=1 Tax=Marinobacter sp. ST-43 TaxID=3050453 RepID=UPI0026DF035A